MFYLALQILVMLGTTAALFFGLGYAFQKRFGRARIVVSDQPPASPPPPKHSDDFDQVVRDLKTRLLEKERDIAELLQSVTPPPDEPKAEDLQSRITHLESDYAELQQVYDEHIAKSLEMEKRCFELEEEKEARRREEILNSGGKLASLSAEITLKNSRIEEFQAQLDHLRSVLVTCNSDLDSANKHFEAEKTKTGHLEERLRTAEQERDEAEQRKAAAEMAKQEAQSESVSDEQLEKLRADLAEKTEDLLKSARKIESLEAQLYEKEYLLQVRRNIEQGPTEDLSLAKKAIWAEEELAMLPVQSPPRDGDGLGEHLSRLERELRDKIHSLETGLENLRSENEMALMVAEAPSSSHKRPIEWEAPMEPVYAKERDEMVQALWKEEADAEKLRLRKSVEDLKNALDQKEEAIGTLEHQVEDLSHKVDPSLVGPDDLELINGIGPYICRMLDKEFGIKTFAQVACLDPKEIDRISRKLFFKGKIEREEWRNQAHELHHRKYNEILPKKI